MKARGRQSNTGAEVVSLTKAAIELGLPLRKALKQVMSGGLPGFRVGSRWYLKRADIESRKLAIQRELARYSAAYSKLEVPPLSDADIAMATMECRGWSADEDDSDGPHEHDLRLVR